MEGESLINFSDNEETRNNSITNIMVTWIERNQIKIVNYDDAVRIMACMCAACTF